ncbi:ribose-5-phosphate isomerase-like protein [Dimargaris cristalligena]|uniref:Ribose-5-phosphate isomerase n=1 Tax=Dimargaris cristalligena TaxID=215637 RepID=A0A4P9ZZ07_9FUNG|nr:ribose-5-phosphate isomerase-like protein [Dimargaris cristalligena]|eukprot:RKP38212.1 ribose-5-phosphate isomerase-like protein [Dimargaris cristalligena]
MSSSADLIETAKQLAAYQAVDHYVNPQVRVLGVGSGSTIVYAIHRLAEQRAQLHPDLVCIPTSFQSRQLLIEAGFRVGDLDEFPQVDVTIDGADEVDAQLNVIKGGGAAQLREKVVAAASKVFVIVADHRKDSTHLGQQWTKGVPIEVIPFAYNTVMAQIATLRPTSTTAVFEQNAPTVTLRMALRKAGPVITDNGNFVLDAHFGLIYAPGQLFDQLIRIPGVVEVGLFCGMAAKAYFGKADGTVVSR